MNISIKGFLKNGKLTVDIINFFLKVNLIKKDLICPPGHNYIIAPKQRSGDGYKN